VPLPEGGRSRRYLRESFPRCLDPYPGRPYGARARFFPQGIGLPPFLTGSAPHKIPHNDFRTGLDFRGCSHSLMFRPPGLLATQVVPTAGLASRPAQGSRDFYVHAELGSLPPRAVDMLTVRIEQLTVEGLSPSKIRGLAGRSVG
jgi:hypothetical protein